MKKNICVKLLAAMKRETESWEVERCESKYLVELAEGLIRLPSHCYAFDGTVLGIPIVVAVLGQGLYPFMRFKKCLI